MLSYEEFVQMIGKHKILPFSAFIPEYPALTEAASANPWHSELETDPWPWRVRVVVDEAAAYGKFFGDKAVFVHPATLPLLKTALTAGKSVEQRYKDGLISQNAVKLHKVIAEHGTIDSRTLRKEANMDAKEHKKEYDKSLVDLQNFADIVITGAQESDNEAGWKSMCYELSDRWLAGLRNRPSAASGVAEAKAKLAAELSGRCTEKAYKYFAKKLGLDKPVT